MKSNFKRIFLIGMIIPTLVFLISLSIFIMYRVHGYNTLKKEKEKTVRVKTEVLVKPNILIIDQKIDSSLNSSKNYDKI
jgi:sensor domain CHASE-containing protein